ncbi:hypothetical protein [Sphingomonas abaci]|uniref:Uncharacterized protein n=1 Tax=Sphingomonas abaci TaxID=237611 RepID=A0A7W7AH82_9SPHN|nr:hypothetical protein [Sphingomonas abaci]MBB4616941.1 hypothetical protein [Sphingomonas abaci]
MFHTPILASWTSDRRVRRILNSFRTRPAPVVTIHAWDRWDGRDITYAGFRVDCLRRLRTAILDPMFLAAEAAGDQVAMRRIMDQPTVEQAIDRAEARWLPLTGAVVSADNRQVAA